MSQEMIAILQRSLVETEKVRQRQWIAFGTLFLATVGSLLWIGHLSGRPSTDVRELIVWAVIAVVVSICYGVMALAIYINRTTARVFRTMQGVAGQL